MMFLVWEKSNTFTPLYTLNTEWSALSLVFGWFHVICWRARLRSCVVGDSRNSRICCSTCVLPLVHPGGDHKNFRLRGRGFIWHDNLLPKLLFVEWFVQFFTDLLSQNILIFPVPRQLDQICPTITMYLLACYLFNIHLHMKLAYSCTYL